jgi:hypothetical protein
VATAAGSFTMKSWDEKPYEHVEGGPKISHTHSTNTYTGDISGESSANYVIFYPEETVGVFRGYEQISGSIRDREGSFVLEHVGSWEGGTVTTTSTVVEGSGTGDLIGLAGSGGFVAKHDIPETPINLEYQLPG